METYKKFEDALREQKFATADEARTFIRGHSMAADYVLGVLVQKRVLELDKSGAVRGITKLPRAKGVSPEWRDNWPEKELLVEGCIEFPAGRTLKELKEYLQEREEPNGHWLMVHCLRKLAAEGLIEKVGLQYRGPKKAQKPVAPKPPEPPKVYDLPPLSWKAGTAPTEGGAS